MEVFWNNIKAFLSEPWLASAGLIIGGIWALFLFRSSNKRERDNNELLNQPRFKFFDSMNCHSEIKRSCDTPESTCRPMPAQGVTDFNGLGLVNFLIKPHWNREGIKREKFSQFLRENPEEFYSISQPIICLNDNQLIRVEGDSFQIWQRNSI